MAKSGLKVSTELGEKLKSFANGSVKWFAVTIDIGAEQFNLVDSGEDLGPNWSKLHDGALLPDHQPIYVIVKAHSTKWTMVFWCPDTAPVKERMMYSSSLEALKKGFPGVQWTEPQNYRCSEKKEVSGEEWKRATAEVDESLLLTDEELIRKEAHHDSIATGALAESKVSIMGGLPINISDDAIGAFDSFDSTGTVLFSLNGKTETLELVSAGQEKLEEVAASLTNDEPRFIIHKFAHEHEGSQKHSNVFIYFCPDAAKPRKKMFYSSCKSVVVSLLQSKKIDIAKSIERSSQKEISEAELLEELYPKETTKKSIKKPNMKGGGRRATSRPKFDASK